jgi:hypothetical protein
MKEEVVTKSIQLDQGTGQAQFLESAPHSLVKTVLNHTR